jgi:hypothetical protein
MAVYDMEVDIAVRRPPSPANTRTIHSRVAVDDRSSMLAMESEARTLAALMADHWCAMVTAVRIVEAEL